LTSLAGEQSGAQGSYCVSNAADGCGSCVDRFAEPQALSVLLPDDEITISMPDGTLVSGPLCQPACPPTLRIQTLGCEEEYQTVPFDEDQPLMLGLPEGSYAVWVDSHFEAPSGMAGQLHVGFGLVVTSTARERRLINLNGPVECPEAACPQLNVTTCQELETFEAVSLSADECLQCQGASCGADAGTTCDLFPCSDGATVIQGCCTDSDCNGLAPFCGRGAGPHGVCVMTDPL
jgi:hypothetical protein